MYGCNQWPNAPAKHYSQYYSKPAEFSYTPTLPPSTASGSGAVRLAQWSTAGATTYPYPTLGQGDPFTRISSHPNQQAQWIQPQTTTPGASSVWQNATSRPATRRYEGTAYDGTLLDFPAGPNNVQQRPGTVTDRAVIANSPYVARASVVCGSGKPDVNNRGSQIIESSKSLQPSNTSSSRDVIIPSPYAASVIVTGVYAEEKTSVSAPKPAKTIGSAATGDVSYSELRPVFFNSFQTPTASGEVANVEATGIVSGRLPNITDMSMKANEQPIGQRSSVGDFGRKQQIEHNQQVVNGLQYGAAPLNTGWHTDSGSGVATHQHSHFDYRLQQQQQAMDPSQADDADAERTRLIEGFLSRNKPAAPAAAAAGATSASWTTRQPEIVPSISAASEIQRMEPFIDGVQRHQQVRFGDPTTPNGPVAGGNPPPLRTNHGDDDNEMIGNAFSFLDDFE